MPIESAADRLAFLNADDFGVEAAYTPVGGSAVAITGILDDPSARSAVFDQVPSATSRPTFLCREDDLPAAAASGDVGDQLVAAGVTFKVSMIDPDGQGMALLTLARAS